MDYDSKVKRMERIFLRIGIAIVFVTVMIFGIRSALRHEAMERGRYEEEVRNARMQAIWRNMNAQPPIPNARDEQPSKNTYFEEWQEERQADQKMKRYAQEAAQEAAQEVVRQQKRQEWLHPKPIPAVP